MADSFGVSFIPGGVGPDSKAIGGPGPMASPSQQAIKFLSLRLPRLQRAPRFSGQAAMGPGAFTNAPGGRVPGGQGPDLGWGGAANAPGGGALPFGSPGQQMTVPVRDYGMMPPMPPAPQAPGPVRGMEPVALPTPISGPAPGSMNIMARGRSYEDRAQGAPAPAMAPAPLPANVWQDPVAQPKPQPAPIAGGRGQMTAESLLALLKGGL